MGLVDGTTSAKDAFRSMAADIIQQLYRILVVEQLVQSIAGAITGGICSCSMLVQVLCPPVAQGRSTCLMVVDTQAQVQDQVA